MTQVLSAIVTDAEHMPSLVYSLGRTLGLEGRGRSAEPKAGVDPDPGEVWGLGYYQEMHALTVRKPGSLVGSRALYDFVEAVRSRILVSIINDACAPSIDLEQPLRFRHWLFAATGSFEWLEPVGTPIVDRLPAYIRSDFHAPDGARLAFAVLLRELHARGLVSDPLVDGVAIAEALARASEAITMLAKESGKLEAPPTRVIVSNGRVLAAMCLGGAPIHYRRQEGLELPTDAPFLPRIDTAALASSLKSFRAVVVEAGFANDEDAQRAGFSKLPPGKVLWADRRMIPELR